MQSLKDHVFYQWGTPTTIMSDAAKEFTGLVMSKFCKTNGVDQKNTHGYNARANGQVETVMRYLNRAFRLLSDSEYKEWQLHISRIAGAWNAHHMESLGCSPFEASHGYAMATPAESKLPPVSAEPIFMTKADVKRVQVSSTRFQELANSVRQWSRRRTAMRLNARGSSRSFKVGDKVKVYVPPSSDVAQKRGRKAKHLQHYRPGTIISKIGSSAYQVRGPKGAIYKRAVMNIAPSTATGDECAVGQEANAGKASNEKIVSAKQPSLTSTNMSDASTAKFTVGDYVGVR